MRKVKLSNLILALSLALSGISVATLAVETSSKSTVTNAAVGDYYSGSGISDSDTGDALKNALHSLNVSKKTNVGYDEMRYLFKDVDTYSGAGGKIVGFYDNALVGPDWDKGSTWNREHVWPDSRGGDKVEGDMHMVRPTKVSSNSSRGNDAYAANGAFDPGYSIPEYRGIAARIIFYCAIADTSLTITDNTTFGSSQMGKLSDLLAWNKQYAPNTTSSASVALKVEQYRNEKIASSSTYGGNRNPFIDHPEYACRIWGNTNSATRAACSGAEASVISDESLEDIELNQNALSLSAGQTYQLSVIPTPSDGPTGATWTSSNQSVATVSSSGLVTVNANAEIGGYTLITATSTFDSTIKAYCNITIVAEGSGQGESGSGSSGESGDTGDYVLAGSYDFSTTSSTTAISTSTSITGFKTGGDETATISAAEKGNLGYNSTYYNLGLKFGTSSANGSITFALSKPVKKFTMNVAGWTATDTVQVNSETAVTPGVAYTSSDCVKEYSFEFATATNSITVAFTKRGFLQSMSFYTAGSAPKTLQSVAISGDMTNKSYSIGDSWNPAGLTVTGTYSDSSTADLTNDAVWAYSPATATSTSVTSVDVTATVSGISSTAKTVSGITVSAPAPKTLTSIALSGDMTNKSYSIGDSWNPAGLTVTGTYSDSSTANLTSQANWTFDPETADDLTITSIDVMADIDGTIVSDVMTITGISVHDSDPYTYTKVTSNLSDWSGNYLLVYENSETEAFVFNGLSATESYSTATISNGTITSDSLTYVTIAPMTDGYSIKVNGANNNGKYIYGSSGSNAMNFADTERLNTIAYTDGTPIITSNTSVLRWNNATSNGHLFRYYKAASYSTQSAIQLYKANGTVTDYVTIDKSTITLDIDDSETINVLTHSDVVTWESADPTIATVSSSGVVTAIAAGTTTITAKCGTARAYCSVTVNAAVLDPQSITVTGSTSSIQVSATLTLAAAVHPSSAVQTVTWSSSDSSVATVSSSGVVTGVAAGTARIYATSTVDNTVVSDGYIVNVTSSSGGSMDITFKTNSTDGSAELNTLTKLTAEVTAGSNYISSLTSQSKVYAGKSGLKFGSSSAVGSLELATTGLSNITSLSFTTTKYGSETGKFKVTINGTEQSTQITPGSAPATATIKLASATTITSLKIETTAKRAYLGGITFTGGSASTYTSNEFAADFFNNVICDVTGQTAPTFGTSFASWSALSTKYADVTDQSTLVNATYTVSGTGTSTVVTATGTTTQVVAEAMYKYDYIIAKYGTSTYNAFITGRTVPSGFKGSINLGNSNDIMPIAVVGLVLGLTGLGAFFYVRKRKEN